MDKNKDNNNSEDVIKISLTDLLVIIFSCVLVLVLIGYICIISNYKDDVEINNNYVSISLNKTDAIEKQKESNSNKFSINKEVESKGNILTLESYEIDNETLVLNYNLKIADKEIEFIGDIFGKVLLVNGSTEKELETSSFNSFIKINDNEYKIIRRYKIDYKTEINKDTICKLNLSIYKDYVGKSEYELGNWNFEFNPYKEELNLDITKFDINKKLELINNDGTTSIYYAEIKEYKKSIIGSKLTITGDLNIYSEYVVQIFDSYGNDITMSESERIGNMTEYEVYFVSEDIDSSEITIKITEYGESDIGENTVISKGEAKLNII